MDVLVFEIDLIHDKIKLFKYKYIFKELLKDKWVLLEICS